MSSGEHRFQAAAALLSRTAEGHGGGLRVIGHPGIGKTTLCEWAHARVPEWQRVRVVSVEEQSELPLSGLGAVLHSFTEGMDRLSVEHRGVIEAALGRGGPPPEPFLLAAATLHLLAAAGSNRPALITVDDAHWLDHLSAQALAFSARRLGDDPVAVIFTVREGHPFPYGVGLPSHTLGGIDTAEASKLLAERGYRCSAIVVDQLLAATAGNPLGLVEVAERLSAEERSGTTRLPEPLPTAPTAGRAFNELLLAFPPRTRDAAALVAADSVGHTPSVAAALARLDLADSDLEPLLNDIVHRRGDFLVFVHPLARSAAYEAVTPVSRRRLHAALAEVYAEQEDLERHAWHLASAVVAPDEAAADSLVQAATVAAERGGLGATAPALRRAAELTPPGDLRTIRFLQAANAYLLSNQPQLVREVARRATSEAPNPALRPALVLLDASVSGWLGAGLDEVDYFVREGRAAKTTTPIESGSILALASLMLLGTGATIADVTTVAAEAHELVGADGRFGALTATTLVQPLILGGRWDDAGPLLDRLAAHQWDPTSPEFSAAPLAAYCLVWAGRYGEARRVLDDVIAFGRSHAAIFALAFALSIRSELEWGIGEWTAASTDLEEAQRLSREDELGTMRGYILTSQARLLGSRGRSEEARPLIEGAMGVAAGQNVSLEMHAQAALGLLELGAGDWPSARLAYEGVAARAAMLGVKDESSVSYSSGLVEACIGMRDLVAARATTERFEGDAANGWSPGTLAALARAQAYVAEHDANERFAHAIDLAERAGQPFELGRTLLAAGQGLRRERASTPARERLSAALDIFHRLGAEPWARRARRELSAGGWLQPPRPQTAFGAADLLTPQELEVVFPVARGATNKEVATALFLSVKTVEFHLKNVYRKLGLRSRTELARKVAQEAWFERSPN